MRGVAPIPPTGSESTTSDVSPILSFGFICRFDEWVSAIKAVVMEARQLSQKRIQVEKAMTTAKAIVPIIIPFESTDLLLVEYRGEPYVPMKTLVEAIGLNWKHQRAKLAFSPFASLIAKIEVAITEGKHRPMLCMPLAKILGWLMTINTSVLRPYLRHSVTAFQQGCDDTLWRHWRLQRPQRKQSESLDNDATVAAHAIGTRHYGALGVTCGSQLKLDSIAESKIAARAAVSLLKGRRWLVTFSSGGTPELVAVPTDAGVFTPERILNWIREPDGADRTFIPALLNAIGDRLKSPCI